MKMAVFWVVHYAATKKAAIFTSYYNLLCFLNHWKHFFPGNYCIKSPCILWSEGVSVGPSKQLRFLCSLADNSKDECDTSDEDFKEFYGQQKLHTTLPFI
jgi:hypothetical protein